MSSPSCSFRRFVATGLLACSAHAGASVPTLSDCLEAADFIANAAHARDNGMTRAAFIGRLAEDFVLIRAFPAELRWFVKDADDERFLQSAAEHVFAEPAAPSSHRSEFLRACFERLSVLEPLPRQDRSSPRGSR